MMETVFIGGVKTSRLWHSDRKGRKLLKGNVPMGFKR
jgi:hypothetical protein